MRRGPALMTLSALVFAGMLGLVKVGRQELSTPAIVFWRGASAVPLALLLALATGGRWSPGDDHSGGWERAIAVRNRRGLLLRCVLGFAAMSCYFTAARTMPVADLTLVMELQPIVIAVLAPLALGADERPEARTWAALGLGLVGGVLLLAPGLRAGAVVGLWALGGVAASSSAHVVLRALGATESPFAVVFWFQAAVTLLSGIALALSTGGLPAPPPAALWPVVLGVGALATTGQVLMTRAYALDRATVVAVASYSAPLWAAGVDLAFFDRSPSLPSLGGGALIVGAGLWLVARSEVREVTDPSDRGASGSEAR